MLKSYIPYFIRCKVNSLEHNKPLSTSNILKGQLNPDSWIITMNNNVIISPTNISWHADYDDQLTYGISISGSFTFQISEFDRSTLLEMIDACYKITSEGRIAKLEFRSKKEVVILEDVAIIRTDAEYSTSDTQVLTLYFVADNIYGGLPSGTTTGKTQDSDRYRFISNPNRLQ